MADPLPPLVPAEPCQTWAGVFFVRRCGRPAVARCCRCGVAACQDHLRPAPGAVAAGQALAFVCLRCLRPAVQRGVQHHHDHDQWSTAGSGGATEGGRWSGGGGAFSGGGATGSWGGTPTPASPAAGVAAGALASGLAPGADPVFTEADYAAFAAMSEADRDEGGPGYDS